jgi:predicted nucleic acid-binding protein
VILVDSSIWVNHLHSPDATLQKLLAEQLVRIHPFVIGELAAGTLTRRTQVLKLLREMPSLPAAEHDEVLELIERHHLMGRGLGWVDLHLLTACRLADAKLWSRDTRLVAAARELRSDFRPIKS